MRRHPNIHAYHHKVPVSFAYSYVYRDTDPKPFTNGLKYGYTYRNKD